jgi:hypothetical protein
LAHYRVYLLSESSRHSDVREVEAESDAAALHSASEISNPHGVELWCGARMVAVLKSTATSSVAVPPVPPAQRE